MGVSGWSRGFKSCGLGGRRLVFQKDRWAANQTCSPRPITVDHAGRLGADARTSASEKISTCRHFQEYLSECQVRSISRVSFYFVTSKRFREFGQIENGKIGFYDSLDVKEQPMGRQEQVPS